MTISTKKNAVDYSPKWMGVVCFLVTIYGLNLKTSRWSKDFYNTWSAIRNFKSRIGHWSKKKCHRKYTTQVCVLVYISKLLWTNGRLGGGRKH
jgi:hypothetical protein